MTEMDRWEAEFAALESAAEAAEACANDAEQAFRRADVAAAAARAFANEAAQVARRARDAVNVMLAQSGMNWWEK